MALNWFLFYFCKFNIKNLFTFYSLEKEKKESEREKEREREREEREKGESDREVGKG
jgi:hypothetical protein